MLCVLLCLNGAFVCVCMRCLCCAVIIDCVFKLVWLSVLCLFFLYVLYVLFVLWCGVVRVFIWFTSGVCYCCCYLCLFVV